MKKFKILPIMFLLLFFAACGGDSKDIGTIAEASQNTNPSEATKTEAAEPAPTESKPTEAETAATKPENNGATVSADSNSDYSDMNVVVSHENTQFPADENAKIVLYTTAEVFEGEVMFDDGQEWALVLETKDGNYTVVERTRIQLGILKFSTFIDYTDESFHILAVREEGAGVQITDNIFDSANGVFKQEKIYDKTNINLTSPLFR